MRSERPSKDKDVEAGSSSKADGDDLLTKPVKHFDGISTSSISDLIESFRGTAFQSRNLARCFDVMLSMLQDSDRPTVFLALAGAMVPGGLRKTVRDMIDLSMVDVLVSTGANLYHDLHEALGFRHYLAERHVSDRELRKRRIDRIYDVFVSDEEFTQTDIFIKRFADSLSPRC